MPEFVRSEEGALELPASLFEALGSPRKVVWRRARREEWVIYLGQTNHHGRRASLARTLRGMLSRNSILRRWVNPPKFEEAWLEHVGDGAARFRTFGRLSAQAYGIVDTGSGKWSLPYSLIPVSDLDDRGGCQARWEEMVGYHEHLPPESQMESANRVSAWVAEEVFEPLGASSFLEIGCGAGRNLAWLRRTIPDVRLAGLDVNPRAIETARAEVPGAEVSVGSLYDLARYSDDSFDVVFTAGVLMHVPHDAVGGVVREMHRIARLAVVHAPELHGEGHSFDYHRYPRDYGALYETLGLGTEVEYEVFDPDDWRAEGIQPYTHGKLVSRIRTSGSSAQAEAATEAETATR